MKWRLSGPAHRDAIQIYVQGAERFGFAQVEKYLADLHAIFDRLTVYPKSGRLRHEVSPPVRMMPFRAHLIFDEISDDEILILRVRNGHEDWWSEDLFHD